MSHITGSKKRYFRNTFRTCTAFADLGCDGGGPPPLPLFLLAASGVLVGTSWKRLSVRKERKSFFCVLGTDGGNKFGTKVRYMHVFLFLRQTELIK